MQCAAIIPTRGRPAMLAEAIASVQAQTEPVAELIVVVDGPDPESAKLARGLGCRVIEHPERRGVATARNTGVAEAASEWVAFLDDDDRWHPDRIAASRRYLDTHPDVEAIQSGFWLFGDAVICGVSEPDMSYLNITGRSFDLLLERNRGAVNTATVRRSVLIAAGGFPDGFLSGEDWVMFLNVARLTEWHVLPQRLAYYRRYAHNTGRDSRMAVAALRAIREVWRDLRPAPPHRPLRAYGTAYRWQVQMAVRESVRLRHWRDALEAVLIGRDLLPRWRDRLYALTPLPITWRWDRVFGAHSHGAR